METIAHTPRLPFPEVPGKNTVLSHGDSSRRISSQQQQRATMLGTKVATSSPNIFQRALLWIKGWVQSRVKVWSLNRALSPFIKAAKADNASVITKDHFKKLDSALTDWATSHAASQVAEVVRDNVKSLNLAGLKRLKVLLVEFAPSDSPLEKTLLETVDSSINDAKVKAAKRSLSESLTLFSTLSDNLSNANFVLPAIHERLLTIMELVQPAGKDPREIEFKSASSIITEETLKSWFNGHSLPQQDRIKANLRDIAKDSSLAESDVKADQAMQAFCRSVTTLLGPDDKGHIPTYIWAEAKYLPTS